MKKESNRLLNLVKFIARIYFKTFHDFKVEGLENIPKEGALLIASNHLSNADPPAIGPGLSFCSQEGIICHSVARMVFPTL